MTAHYKDMSVDEARAFIKSQKQDAYTLLDVRQDWEYEEEHIPGAIHIPLSHLADHLHDVPKDKPVIAYCRAGGRSAAAASMLKGDGHRDVFNLMGGMGAWTGEAAVGPGSAGFAFFSGNESIDEIIALACRMEENLGEFYKAMAKKIDDASLVETLTTLAGFEDKHNAWLLTIYRQLTGGELDQSALTASAQEDGAPPLEGGLTAEEFMQRNQPALDSPTAIVEAGMMFEAQALDLYMRYASKAANEASRELLIKLADEEKNHLKALSTLLDRMHTA